MYRYTKERNINELRHNSMYGYENNRNSPVYRYTRTAPKNTFVVAFTTNDRQVYLFSRFPPVFTETNFVGGAFEDFFASAKIFQVAKNHLHS